MNKPNIMLIMCDQFRSDCLSILGHHTVKTPNLDDLAENGTIFTNAYSSVPSCIAARANLFTGKNASKTGFFGYIDGVEWNYQNMLPQVLRDNGYQTHCCGKTHFYPQRKHCGFEGIDSNEASQKLNFYYENDYQTWLKERCGDHVDLYSHGMSDNSWLARASTLSEDLHDTTWTVTKSIDFIKRHDRTRPYFLNISFHRPHPPIDPPQFYWDEYMRKPFVLPLVGDWTEKHSDGKYSDEVKDINAWCGKLDQESIFKCRHGYFAQIAHIDNQIGRLFRRLEMMNEMPDIIIFTSDHGDMLWDHNMFRKTYAFEGSAGVPLIIWTKEQNNVKKVSEPVVLQDIYSTILDCCDIEIPEDVDGISLTDALKGKPISREFIHGEHSRCYSPDEAMQYITDGEYKYIWFTNTGAELLFDMKNDRAELFNLSEKVQHKETLHKYRSCLIELLSGFGYPYDRLVKNGELTCALMPATTNEIEK